MGRFSAVLLIAGAALGRFSVLIAIAGVAAPLVAASPVEPARSVLNGSVDFELTPAPRHDRAGSGERSAYPTELPRVKADDAFRPPDLLWNPTPSSLIKVAPRKVRYKLRF